MTLNSAQEVYSRFDSTIKALSAGQTGTSGGGGGGSGSNGFSLSGSPTVSISEASAVEEVEFTDLDSSHWAYEAVRALKNINVISGYSDGSFMPEKEVTREELDVYKRQAHKPRTNCGKLRPRHCAVCIQAVE